MDSIVLPKLIASLEDLSVTSQPLGCPLNKLKQMHRAYSVHFIHSFPPTLNCFDKPGQTARLPSTWLVVLQCQGPERRQAANETIVPLRAIQSAFSWLFPFTQVLPIWFVLGRKELSEAFTFFNVKQGSWAFMINQVQVYPSTNVLHVQQHSYHPLSTPVPTCLT